MGRWFIGTAGIAIALALAWGGAPDMAVDTNAIDARSWLQDATSWFPRIVPEGETLHGRSLALGIAIGAVLALLSQISWFELPVRILQWMRANEGNFYRVGMAGVFLAVVLFY
ncbi:MAG: hypothetical protein ACK5KM_07555 [Hyphomicrobiaceae bacterium]